MTNDMFGIDVNRPWPQSPLAPLQGAGNVSIAMSQGIGRRWLPQPWALLSAPVGGIPIVRPIGPNEHSPGMHAAMPQNTASRRIPAPNGGQDISPGLSEAMPRDLTTQHVMRPDGAREPAVWGEEVGE